MYKKFVLSIVLLCSSFLSTAHAQSSGCQALEWFVQGTTTAYLNGYGVGNSVGSGLASVIGAGLGHMANIACNTANEVIWDAIEDTATSLLRDPYDAFLEDLYRQQFCATNPCATGPGGRPYITGGGFGFGPRGSVNDIMGGMLCARGMGCGNNDPY